MAASAYAALASITHVLEQLQHPARHRLRFDRSQIETLHEMVRYMLNFFEAHPTVVYDTDEEDVLRDMANCITEAEDVIDSHVVDQLRQNIFHDPCFKNHFDIRIWLTISQEYRVSDILLGLLGEEKEGSSQNIAELGQKLYQKLFGQRYLIILDDVWTINVWDDLKLYFPNTSEGSRIIVTTRLSSISDSLGNDNSYSVELLDDEKSWELLCQKAFGKVGCPDPKFEEIGRSIASDCNGLPLAIVVIGGLLSKSDVTLEKWEEVAKNVNSIVNSEDDELCLNILSLSYNHLPIHLKPCFLYMRVYPEDYNVGVSQLIQFWIGEGFVISKGGQTLEAVAREYLKDLIDRNLILTNYEFRYGEMKNMVGIHDLLRDLCIRKSQRVNTFRILRSDPGIIITLTPLVCTYFGIHAV